MSDEQHDAADGGNPEDRRAEPRHLACFPAHVKVGRKKGITLIKDVSVTGALLLATQAYEVDSNVVLSLHLSGDPDDKPTKVRGKIVRSEPQAEDRRDVWAYVAAVKFHRPQVDLEERFRAVASKQSDTRRSEREKE